MTTEALPTEDGVDDLALPDLSLMSRRLFLRPIVPRDHPFLYQLAMAPTEAYHWRFRGRQPSFDDFVRSLYSDVFVQYLIVRRHDGKPLGLVVCYRADHRNRHAHIALQGVPRLQGTGVLIEAGHLFVDFLFRCYEFEKLYAECPGFNMVRFTSALGGLLVEEGRLRDHERMFGRSWDLHMLALYRRTWEQRPPSMEERVARRLAELQVDGGTGNLTIEEFCALIAREFDLGPEEVRPESRLADELGFDSVQMYELLCILEELGSYVEESTFASVVTVDDTYFRYVQHKNRN
ncbi:MAG: GNAT family N-acetyltransferase [Acidimicrobiales bacterium]